MLFWHKNAEGMKKKIFFSFSQLLLLLLLMTTSCSTKRMVSQTMERDSIRTEHRDSVAERNKDVNDTRHYTGRERLREITRTYIITPLGDTVKSHVQEREMEHTWDSLLSAQRSEIERLHKQVGSMREKLLRNATREKVVEKSPSIRQRIGETLMWLTIGAVVMLVIIKKR